MNKNTIIDNKTLLPLGAVLAFISTLFMIFTWVASNESKSEVQAAEINHIKLDYYQHKKTSEKYFMAISKALSRIEGKLEQSK